MEKQTADVERGRIRVLVLDGDTRAALAVVRSLGAQGYDVAVGSSKDSAIASSSGWVGVSFVYPCPQKYPDRFTHWLSRTVEVWHPEVVLPMSDLSLSLVLDFEESFREMTVLPTVSKEVFTQVSDKANLMQLARSRGVKVPKTRVISTAQTPDQIVGLLADFSFPAVVKPRSSVQRSGASVLKAEVSYANSADHVCDILTDETVNQNAAVEFLVQEKIVGVGVGVFALCFNGEVLTTFAHKRLLEKPPSGGRSVLSRSIALKEAPVEQALDLLRHYAWSGVAMVEFKKTPDGEFFLMEINPRFWGSLQLAIDAGRDFPAYLMTMVCAQNPNAPEIEAIRRLPEYRTDVGLRWLYGCLDHFLIRLKSEPIKTIVDVFLKDAMLLRVKNLKTRFEVFRTDDFMPFLVETRLYFMSLFRLGK